MPKQANLVAVQARMERADYRDADAFRAKIAALMRQVAATVDFTLPTLVSFPELIGMYLSILPRYWDDLQNEQSLEAGATRIVMQNFGSLAEEHRTSPEAAARRLLFVDTAVEAEAAYCDAFASLSREYGCYIAAGSIALPWMDHEPSKGGRHVADGTKVYNTAYLFSPRGMCLSRVPKVNMTSGLEARLFDSGSRSDLIPVDTALGRIGTLICFDGFHETLVERYDAQGVEILLKPSYNQQAWEAPSSYDPDHGEGENWLRTGCPAIIQGRENIRYGVNAMLVGGVFEDTYAEGRSTIAVNTGDPDACWDAGLLAIAKDVAVEEVIAATVELGR